ncbi:hypothetical protein COHA_004885 [Chlorella ohadii]|uniref:Uncharacterized protein n=1 Tax=Chlorella ohadii TaxID=2649997 RepID=A0AAD5H6W8_9CHLO|nr:hypothetical protein COHA_004885 [Chlorella ohadii]
MAGRGLRACCFAARPGATLSFKEAPDAAQQQPQAAHHSASSSSSLDDVLGLLPADGPQKDEAAPPVASKASFCHEIAEERIPAGTYIAAAVAAVAPAAEQHETAEPWPDAALPERSSHTAEEADRDALPLSTAEQDSTQQFASPDEQASLEAAVGAALGLPMPAACNVSASRARPAASGASGCSMSASHLSLELQVAEALGDLHPAAGTADCLALQAPGGEGSLARCCSGSGSTAGLSSPWRTSTSSFGAEPEASKRFSCCGSACPVLETLRESISTQEQSSVSLAAAPSCPTFAGDAGGALTDEPGAAAASERQQPQDEQLAGSCTEGAADIGDEVAALLGGMLPGPAPTSLTWPGEAATQQSTLTNILALLGQPQESSSPSQPAAGGATCPAPEDGFDAAICQLLLGGGSEEQVAVPAAEAAARPVSAGAMQAGRLASLSQGSEAGWREAEAHPPAAFPPPAAAAAAAVATLPADEAADWPAGGDGSAPAEECSSSSGTSGSAALAGCTAACTALAASVTRPADLPLFGNAPPIIPCTRAPPSWSSDGGEGADPLASMHDRAVRQRREAEHIAASRTAGALLSPAKAGRPLSASARLYAHAVDLQGRQRQAAALRDQEQRAALLAASPKAKPFPRAQHTNPPSPPLSRRSPPVSRPGSAPPPGLLCASLEQAAVQVELAGLGGLAAGELGGRAHQAAGRAPERSTTGKAASYWQRWGLEAGPDFDGFLQRQEKFVQALGAKLDAERHLPAAQQAAAAAPGAHLSPGSRRLLERRRQRELALEMEAAGCMRASMAGCDAAGDHSTHSSPLHHSGAFGHAGLEGTGACQSASMAGSVPAPAPSAFPYRPVITSRAAAKPARTPEELHAEAARRQAKLDLGAYMREVREKQAAREEAAAAAAKARQVRLLFKLMHAAGQNLASQPRALAVRIILTRRASTCTSPSKQERELAQCTFQPNLGHGQRSPTKQSGPGKAPAAGAASAASSGTASGLAVKAARPPDVLAQVQALLRGDSTAEAAAICTAASGATAAPGRVGTAQQVAAIGDGVPAVAGVATAGQAGAAGDGFSAFLSQVTMELKRLQEG